MLNTIILELKKHLTTLGVCPNFYRNDDNPIHEEIALYMPLMIKRPKSVAKNKAIKEGNSIFQASFFRPFFSLNRPS